MMPDLNWRKIALARFICSGRSQLPRYPHCGNQQGESDYCLDSAGVHPGTRSIRAGARKCVGECEVARPG